MKFDPSDIRALIHVATRRTGTPLHDEDLEQDIALRALEAFKRLDAITHPRGLLMKIVHDAVRDHWRRRRAAEDIDDVDERFISHLPAIESDLDRDRRATLVRQGLQRLPANKRKLLELFYIHDHSIPHIAATQGRSISAVKMELARSRRALARIVRSLEKEKK